MKTAVSVSTITRPALRYHGAKFRLASWILQFFPPHRIYTEAFGGAAGVLLQKPASYAEIYNDLDSDVCNFFRVLRDPSARLQLMQACQLTPYAREEFEEAFEATENDIERARRLAIRAQMGFGSAGATKGITGLRIDTKRKHGTAQQDWVSYPAAIAAAGQRFAGVLIENRPALEVLQQHDDPDALHFVDPPYMHSTRVMRVRTAGKATGAYRHELSDEEHEELLEVLDGLKGMVVLSGYASEAYDLHLAHWRRFTTEARISAGRGTAVRMEVVWINPSCAAALQGTSGGLFAEAA